MFKNKKKQGDQTKSEMLQQNKRHESSNILKKNKTQKKHEPPQEPPQKCCRFLRFCGLGFFCRLGDVFAYHEKVVWGFAWKRNGLRGHASQTSTFPMV